MIRRTVARAFGMSGDERPRADEPPAAAAPNGSRIALLNQFFGELQEAFERAAREGVGGGANGGGDGAGAAAARISKTRPRPEGLEFTIDGPRGAFRFLNTLDGIIWIHRDESGR